MQPSWVAIQIASHLPPKKDIREPGCANSAHLLPFAYWEKLQLAQAG